MFTTQNSIMGAVDLYAADNAGPGPFSLVGTNAGKYGRWEYPAGQIDAVDTLLGGGSFVFAQVAAIAAVAISSITISGTTATITTGSAHGLNIGHCIQISGAIPTAYNGLWVLATVPSSTTATFSMATVVQPNWNPANGVVNPTNTNVPTTNATTVGTYVPGLGAGQVVQFSHVKDAFGQMILQAAVWTGTAIVGQPLGASICQALALTASSNPANPFAGQFAWFQVRGLMAVYSGGAPAAGNPAYFSANGFVQPSAVASKQVLGAQYGSALAATIGAGTGLITLPANVALLYGQYPTSQGAIT